MYCSNQLIVRNFGWNGTTETHWLADRLTCEGDVQGGVALSGLMLMVEWCMDS